MNVYGVDISPDDVAWAVNSGLPLQAGRRLLGLGDAASPRTCWLPGWSTFALGILAGALAGMYVAKVKPEIARKVLGR